MVIQLAAASAVATSAVRLSVSRATSAAITGMLATAKTTEMSRSAVRLGEIEPAR